MTKTHNLRFLLALGNKKVVVLKEKDSFSVYSDKTTEKSKNSVSLERLTDAVSSTR